MARWEDLNARAKGLATHLMRRNALEALIRAPGSSDLADELRRLGYLVDESSRGSAASLELAARRKAASQMGILFRWFGSRADALAVVIEDEDRRSLRAILRGSAQRAAPDLKLAGLLPTPALPERALEELARQPEPSRVTALLVAWGHPYGEVLLEHTAGPDADLFSLELALSRAFAARALRAARRADRGGLLEDYVRQVIDVENGAAAILLAEDRDEHPVTDAFLEGGRRVTADVFRAAVGVAERVGAAARIAAAFSGTRLAGAFRAGEPGEIEGAILAAQIVELHRAALRHPLSVAPLLEYALRLRAELLDVRWIIWGRSLGAPIAVLTDGLVSERP